MEHEIIDYAPSELFDGILEMSHAVDFPWRLHRGCSTGEDPGVKMAKHVLINGEMNLQIPEHHRKTIYEIPKWMHRQGMLDTVQSIRMNMTFKGLVPDHPPHIDHPNPLLKTALFYCSDTNGGTLFPEHDLRVPGDKHTAVLFPAKEWHRVEGHTEGDHARIIVNIVYLPTYGEAQRHTDKELGGVT